MAWLGHALLVQWPALHASLSEEADSGLPLVCISATSGTVHGFTLSPLSRILFFNEHWRNCHKAVAGPRQAFQTGRNHFQVPLTAPVQCLQLKGLLPPPPRRLVKYPEECRSPEAQLKGASRHTQPLLWPIPPSGISPAPLSSFEPSQFCPD